jgi:hypothetical protein
VCNRNPIVTILGGAAIFSNHVSTIIAAEFFRETRQPAELT